MRDGSFSSTPLFGSSGVQPFAVDQLESKILEKAGALPQDALGWRQIGEFRNKTGGHGYDSMFFYNAKPLPAYNPPKDSDGDGMPDWWEQQNSLDPADKGDGQALHASGYSHLEKYLHYLANELIQGTENPWQGSQSVAVDNPKSKGKRVTSLLKAHPNPFKNEITISFKENSKKVNGKEKIFLEIFNVTGKRVYQSEFSAAQSAFTWNGRKQDGQRVSPGIYLIQAKFGSRIMGSKSVVIMQ